MSPYGRACLQCTKAKVRCAYSDEADKGPCERCARLKKDCQPAPRSRVPKNKHRVDKHSALEARVDGIVEILKRSQNIPDLDLRQSNSPDPSARPQRCGPALAATPLYQLSIQAGNQEKDPLSTAAKLSDVTKVTCEDALADATSRPKDASQQDSYGTEPRHHPGRPKGGLPIASPFGYLLSAATDEVEGRNQTSPLRIESSATGHMSRQYPTPASSIVDGPAETNEELQGILDTYREIMFPFSPVVYLGPDVSIEHMVNERPHLWTVIQMICTKKLVRQLALGDEINRMIAQKLIIEGERTFDMLCALLVYINWGQFSCVKANLSPPIHLAYALAGDLGLLKPAPQTSPAVMMNFTQAGCPKPPQALAVKKRTIEERRVVLGLFYVWGICACFFQRTEPMRWTHYLEECLAMLTELNDLPSDQLLTTLVRIQIIANSMQSDSWNETYPMSSPGQKAPRSHMMPLHKMQLDELKRAIPTGMKNNPILRYHLVGAEICLHEHYLSPPAAPLTSLPDQTRHVEGLWACFNTVKSYTDYFFDIDDGRIPLKDYLYLPICVYTHLGHSLVAIFRLSTFEASGIPWDRQYVIKEVDLGKVVRQWIHIMESSPKEAGIDIRGAEGQESQWEYSRKILQPTILKWWESKVRPSIMGSENEAEQASDVQQPTIPSETFDANMPDMDFGDIDFNFDTEIWMRDMLSSGFDFKTW